MLKMENKLSPLRIGAISELQVCQDLMIKGFDAFRAVAQNACCDIVAIKNNQVIRIEVRTTSENDNGNIKQAIKRVDEGRSDCYAWVTETNIVYDPPVELIVTTQTRTTRTDNDPTKQNKLLRASLTKASKKFYSFLYFLSRYIYFENQFTVETKQICFDFEMLNHKEFNVALRELKEHSIISVYGAIPVDIHWRYGTGYHCKRYVLELNKHNYVIQPMEQMEYYVNLYIQHVKKENDLNDEDLNNLPSDNF